MYIHYNLNNEYCIIVKFIYENIYEQYLRLLSLSLPCYATNQPTNQLTYHLLSTTTTIHHTNTTSQPPPLPLLPLLLLLHLLPQRTTITTTTTTTTTAPTTIISTTTTTIGAVPQWGEVCTGQCLLPPSAPLYLLPRIGQRHSELSVSHTPV